MNAVLEHVDALSAEREAISASDSNLLMTEFSIVHAGRYYHYDGYRYEHLEDAVAYAQVVRSRHTQQAGAASPARFETGELPNASDRQLMIALSITFEDGRFVFEGFRYDLLIDAVNYARDHGHRNANAS